MRYMRCAVFPPHSWELDGKPRWCHDFKYLPFFWGRNSLQMEHIWCWDHCLDSAEQSQLRRFHKHEGVHEGKLLHVGIRTWSQPQWVHNRVSERNNCSATFLLTVFNDFWEKFSLVLCYVMCLLMWECWADCRLRVRNQFWCELVLYNWTELKGQGHFIIL